MIALPGSPHGAYRRSDLERKLGSDVVRDALADGTLTLFGRGVLVDARRVVALHTRAAATILLAGPDVALTGYTALAVWAAPPHDRDQSTSCCRTIAA
ncbi:hypothetical protein [Haloechinothrix halophila]|uniref:hypothetical protein n=1 Tax=Haloechinothrix halophila TaxID=1069073 RepID=UPI0012FA8E8C|nr:hypothetical protein [Haloechinothrix halophila]